MFERFTERARQVVVLAQEEARTLKCEYVGTEHVLLGLLREEEGLAARVLESFDITVEGVRARARPDWWVTWGAIPFTSQAKKACELALREALSLGHNYIGTEHILLGLVRENGGLAADILLDLDADSEKIRSEVIWRLSGARKHAATVTGPTVELNAHVLYELLAAGDELATRLASWGYGKAAVARWQAIASDEQVKCAVAQHGPSRSGRAKAGSRRA